MESACVPPRNLIVNNLIVPNQIIKLLKISLMENTKMKESESTDIGYIGTVELIQGNGEVPDARFGHTITAVRKTRVVLFGGATGDTGKYGMRGETYILNVETMTWKKLEGK